MTTRNETGFRHNLRVRIGAANGPTGRLLRCHKRDSGDAYWRVRLTSGEWVWPDRIIVDGIGDVLIDACTECQLPFIGQKGDLLCLPCDEEQFGARERAADTGARDATAHRNWLRTSSNAGAKGTSHDD